LLFFDDFTVQLDSRDENTVVHNLAQQAHVSEQIEKNSIFWKNRIFQFAKPDNLFFSRCVVR
jgi:hypothetical protein